MEQYNKCLLIHLWFQSHIDTQNQSLNDNNNIFSTTHTMKIFKLKKCNSCGAIMIHTLIFTSGKILLIHFWVINYDSFIVIGSYVWPSANCIMKSVKGQHMTDISPLESMTITIWLKPRSLVSYIAVVLATNIGCWRQNRICHQHLSPFFG